MIMTEQDLYVQREETISLIHKQTRFIKCPYCHAHNKDQLIDDYYEEAPPVLKSIVVTWLCDNCQTTYKTNHRINRDGVIIPPKPATEVIE